MSPRPPPPRSWPAHRVGNRPRAGSAFQRPDADDAFRLWNLAPLLPEDQRLPRVFKGRGELIDHIFATHRLVNPGNLPTVQTILSVDPLPSIGDDPTSRRNEPGSTTPPWSPPSTSDLDRLALSRVLPPDP
jgi:hypothetical protein